MQTLDLPDESMEWMKPAPSSTSGSSATTVKGFVAEPPSSAPAVAGASLMDEKKAPSANPPPQKAMRAAGASLMKKNAPSANLSAPSAVAAAEQSLTDEKLEEDNAEALRRAQLSMRAEQKEKAEKAKEEKKKNKEDKSEKTKACKPKRQAKPKGRPRKGAVEEEGAPARKTRKRKSKRNLEAVQDEEHQEAEQPVEAVEAEPAAKKPRKKRSRNASGCKPAENALDEEKVQRFLDLCRKYDGSSYDRSADTLHKKEIHPKLILVPYFTRPACGVKIKLADGTITQRIYMSGKYDTVAVNIQQCIYLAEELGQQDPEAFVEWCASADCLQRSVELERCAMAAKQRFFEEKRREANHWLRPSASFWAFERKLQASGI